jgi:hypothetical protein
MEIFTTTLFITLLVAALAFPVAGTINACKAEPASCREKVRRHEEFFQEL